MGRSLVRPTCRFIAIATREFYLQAAQPFVTIYVSTRGLTNAAVRLSPMSGRCLLSLRSFSTVLRTVELEAGETGRKTSLSLIPDDGLALQDFVRERTDRFVC